MLDLHKYETWNAIKPSEHIHSVHSQLYYKVWKSVVVIFWYLLIRSWALEIKNFTQTSTVRLILPIVFQGIRV